jgi:hypothetical protein
MKSGRNPDILFVTKNKIIYNLKVSTSATESRPLKVRGTDLEIGIVGAFKINFLAVLRFRSHFIFLEWSRIVMPMWLQT